MSRAAHARYCIVGAGYAGIGAARAFRTAGIDYDHLEATDVIGGNWSNGPYDSAHLISSKKSTQFPEYPMPAHYPTFPHRTQMLEYLNDYADHFRLRERIEFGTRVAAVWPVDQNGMAGWTVRLADGQTRTYQGVVLANGHRREPHIPSYPGTFVGLQLHSSEYRRPPDFGSGGRVLVVGAGNAGCALVVEAASVMGTADISMRRSRWLIPQTVCGVATSDLDRVWVPAAVKRAAVRALARLSHGVRPRRRLDHPNHLPAATEVTVDSPLLHTLRHGTVRRRPEIQHYDGSTVHFVDGTTGDYDTIVWATGYHTRFPSVDESMFTWDNGNPLLVGHVLVPHFANLYVWGLAAPRSGVGRIASNGADFLVELVGAQRRFDVPVADVVAARVPARAAAPSGTGETLARLRITRRLLRFQVRRARTLRMRPQRATARPRVLPHSGRSDTAAEAAHRAPNDLAS